MQSLSETELVYLQAVERRSAHRLGERQRQAALASLEAKGLVKSEYNTGNFQLAGITDAGRRTLAAVCPPLDWREECNSRLASIFRRREAPIRILDAGGGRKCGFKPPERSHLTVCDTDAAALASNARADEKVLGDVALLDFAGRQFDLIAFWDVLEHLKSPLEALVRTVRAALAPGGAVLIKGPIVSSLQGLVTKYSPHFLHVAFYRHILGHAHAGEPGHCPYRTTLSPGADDRAITEALLNSGLEIVAHRRFRGPHVGRLKQKSRLAHLAFRGLSALVSAATEGRAGGEESDFFILAQRPIASAAA